MKIFCVGRNYVEHAKELGNAVPDAPVIFMKPPTALVKFGKPIYYPTFTSNLHYEGELVVKICKNGKAIAEKFAHKYCEEVSLGFDLTARDIQSKQKEKGLPWEIAKGFDGAAPIGDFIPIKEALNGKPSIEFSIEKNGKIVQEGDTSLMLFSIDKIISYISSFFTLQKGDLIFTGTPKGVGELQIGDQLSGYINGNKLVSVEVK